MNYGDEDFEATLFEIIPLFQAHAEGEERQLFSKAETLFEPELAKALADRILKFRAESLREDIYRNAQPEVVQDPNGGEQMRKFAG